MWLLLFFIGHFESIAVFVAAYVFVVIVFWLVPLFDSRLLLLLLLLLLCLFLLLLLFVGLYLRAVNVYGEHFGYLKTVMAACYNSHIILLPRVCTPNVLLFN